MINDWRVQRVHEQPGYEHVAALLRAPVRDATALMDRRFPTPRFIECVEKGSQARFLMAKLNPVTSQSTNAVEGVEAPVFTEDVSLRVFIQHLRRLSVTDQ